MKIRVLGCAGAEFPGFNPPAFLLDGTVLLDAGTTGAVLTAAEQERITHILLTHAHLDHVRGLPFLADNIVVANRQQTLQVLAIPEVIDILRHHLMNGLLWPDFSTIPTPELPAIAYRHIVPGEPLLVAGYTVEAVPVHHSVPAVGYVIRGDGCSFLYTGDTGPTDRLWAMASGLDALVVEVSFPNEMAALARTTGHLTSRLLAGELAKVRDLPSRIFITHPKPQYYEQIRDELAHCGIPHLELLRDGMTIEL